MWMFKIDNEETEIKILSTSSLSPTHRFFIHHVGKDLNLSSGNKIQAGIKKEHISKFQRYVKKGDWKIIDDFSVNKATGQYRSTIHPYRINFHYSTVFSPSPSINNEVWLDLVDFTTIIAGNLDQNKLVDVLGQLVNVGEAQKIDVQGKPTKKIDFQLRVTDDNRLPCSLWGKFADQISKVAQESLGSVVIVLVRLPSDGLALTIMGPKPRFQPLKVREQRSLGLPLKTIAELKASYEKNDQPTDLKVDGVVDLDNPKEHDQPKFLHKLDEAGQEAITKVSEAEQKKVLLKKIKVEKIEGQKGAK
ncbi:hypothetical protein ARALYDRAFT_359097 [Arabidopsis lyrata subsp. lyrata]|uniref:Replication protein A 70 kDa DNA-binding subunit B/D first OB fold domain-containing protein n=1 Tax=Arabidopsis lyrata subsp. lyrata TaxID=81972 RepID=D7MVK1_ARALL|nr:hypothetical protein ARALYDRAFT_359097 [Arabidopsis lyrata subsp. lyrata]